MTTKDINFESFPDEKKLFYVALGGVQELKNYFNKEIPYLGQFEVLLFNSVIVLQSYNAIHPDELDHYYFKNQYYEILHDFAIDYKVPFSKNVTEAFVLHRTDFYSDEIANIFNNENEIAGKIYSAFYDTPLMIQLTPCTDLSKLLLFKTSLTQLVIYLKTNVNSIIN